MGLQEKNKVIYITKWALTKGILKREAEVNLDELQMGRYAYAYVEGLDGLICIGQDAFFTLEEAIAKAEDIRKRKIDQVKKKLEKLKKMTFEVKWY